MKVRRVPVLIPESVREKTERIDSWAVKLTDRTKQIFFVVACGIVSYGVYSMLPLKPLGNFLLGSGEVVIGLILFRISLAKVLAQAEQGKKGKKSNNSSLV